jgi:light-regulated signal transduction histidine kinase (bacteriophytochrome)
VEKGHGGSIDVESKEGEVSDFIVTLPVNKPGTKGG